MTWQHYLSDTRDELLPRYVELCEEVAMRSEELGLLYADEKRARAEGFRNSEFTSVSGMEHSASLQATDVSCEIFKLKAELDAVREERDIVRFALDRSNGHAAP